MGEKRSCYFNYPASPLRKNTDNELDEYDTPMQEAYVNG